MVSVEKIAHLALHCGFDSSGPNPISSTGSPYPYDQTTPDLMKLSALGKGTRYDVCASSSTSREVQELDRVGDVTRSGICHAFTGDGRCISLFKTLYTNLCHHQCHYCSNSAISRSPSTVFSYSPEELARVILSLYQGNYIEGLFLSSGTGRDEDRIMEGMVETVRLLRNKYRFLGYVHLKIMPGASKERIQEAMELADRVSINLEAPSGPLMEEISATKDYQNDILQRQRYVRDLMQKVMLPAGQTTQLVVGGAGESDFEIFKSMLWEYQEMGLKRIYYSAFTPVLGTPFDRKPPQPLWREHRLYQMDWLYRVYKFRPFEILHSFNEDGFLDNADPKVAIARVMIDEPLDPNHASYQDLIRVPGIGPRSARRILALRRLRKISRKEDLAPLGVVVKRASPFLKINGWKETTLDRWWS
jgi:putative DNA modification/repair radical SAM protein